MNLKICTNLASALAKVSDMTSCCNWRPHIGTEVIKAAEVIVPKALATMKLNWRKYRPPHWVQGSAWEEPGKNMRGFMMSAFDNKLHGETWSSSCRVEGAYGGSLTLNVDG